MEYGVRLIVDGVLHEAEIKNSLEEILDSMAVRHNEAVAFYERGASYAPAFGMCATVVALVNMLTKMDFTDPDAVNALSTNMATAMITTLYGSVFANIIFLPIAGRLKLLHKREIFNKTLICTGILAIMQGKNVTFIREFLYEQLNKENRRNMSTRSGGLD